MSRLERGVVWICEELEFPGARTLMVTDSGGRLILEMKVPREYADAQAEGVAWEFLNRRDPKGLDDALEDEYERSGHYASFNAREHSSPEHPNLTVSLGGNKPQRRSKRAKAPPQLTVLH
jgi:hypothetical protein